MDAKKGGKKAGDVIEVKERVFMEKHMDDYVSNKNIEQKSAPKDLEGFSKW